MQVIKSLWELKQFFKTNNYVDVYIYKDHIIAKDFSDTKKVADIQPEIPSKDIYRLVNHINEESWVDLNIPLYTEYFAVYLKESDWKLKGFRWTYWESIDWEYMNFRWLSSPRPLNSFLKDPYLIKFFAESFLYNNSVIVSWPTGSWKTTLLVSFFDFINQYTSDKYKKELLQQYILQKKWIKLSEDKVEEFYNANLDIDDKEYFIENLKRDNYYKMLEFIEKENKKVVYGIENPIEYYHKSKNIQFLQHDVLTHWNINTLSKWMESKFPSLKWIYKTLLSVLDKIATSKVELVKWSNLKEFQNLADKALRTNPEYLLIWEIKNPLEFDIFLRAISFWLPVYTTSHSDDSFSMIQRIYDTSSFSPLEKLWLIARWIYWIVNTRIFFFKSLWKAMAYFDVLFLNDEAIRGKLYNFLKEWNLHKFAEELENHWIRRMSDNSVKLYYLNKKSSALYALLVIMRENKLELENPNIKIKFDNEVRFLLGRMSIKKLDIQKFKEYYWAGYYITDEEAMQIEEYITDLWII